jgi:UPF0716 family protein affecting phage T7 exclusion
LRARSREACLRNARLWERVVLFVAALCLIKPGLVTDLVGLALLAVVVAAQKMRPADPAPQAAATR